MSILFVPELMHTFRILNQIHAVQQSFSYFRSWVEVCIILNFCLTEKKKSASFYSGMG